MNKTLAAVLVVVAVLIGIFVALKILAMLLPYLVLAGVVYLGWQAYLYMTGAKSHLFGKKA